MAVNFLRKLKRRLLPAPAPAPQPPSNPVHPILNLHYAQEAPSNQSLADLFKGYWLSVLPDELGVSAGYIRHFDTTTEVRVPWGASVLENGLQGKSVLELGPFEAYNTYQLEQMGAGPVVSVEGCNLSYLKCLVVKELLGIKARFLYGDFIPYLETCQEHFDVIWASGVLYHQTEPLKLLSLIARHTERVFIHTHYWCDAMLKASPEVQANFIKERDQVVEYDGFRARLHYHSYVIEKQGNIFAGGPNEFSYWMEKDDIFAFLRQLGFDQIQIGVDDPDNPYGSAMFFMAQKSA